jgi:hypothetical protein
MPKRTSAAPAERRMDPETEAMLREHLERCRKAIETCFTLDIQRWSGEGVMQGFVIGTRLIKTSLMLAAALEGSRSDFTHRIIVEHVPALPSPQAAIEGPNAAHPHPDKQIRKTIKSGSADGEPQE